ncbi:MAG: Gfo/Idh/MocA family oxidoreductase [Arcobacteraceae bacterium]|nr:Gfo/Idh/MocA family oxidoreductase [Arcobacteraceae bacterium]
MYKLAFIGGGDGSIAGYPHFIASQMDRRFEVIAATFSSNEQTNIDTSKRLNIKNIYKNYKELIENEKSNLDAVVILAPTPVHFEMIQYLLEQNINVICEKPLVSSIDEIEKIEKFYDENNHFLVVTNNYSGYPMVRQLKEEIAQNNLGKILHIRLKMPQESFLRPPKSIKYPQPWRLKDDFIPMISLDLGVHLHHLSYFLLGKEPSKVFAAYDKYSNYDVIDDVNILLEYSDGVKGNFWLSKTALGNRNGLHIEIYGDKGSAVWHQENPEKLQLSYRDGKMIILDRGGELDISNKLYNRMTPGHPSGFIEAFANLYNDIANGLDNYKQNKPYTSDYVYGFNHAKNGLKLLHNASISNEKKEWITNK